MLQLFPELRRQCDNGLLSKPWTLIEYDKEHHVNVHHMDLVEKDFRSDYLSSLGTVFHEDMENVCNSVMIYTSLWWSLCRNDPMFQNGGECRMMR